MGTDESPAVFGDEDEDDHAYKAGNKTGTSTPGYRQLDGEYPSYYTIYLGLIFRNFQLSFLRIGIHPVSTTCFPLYLLPILHTFEDIPSSAYILPL